MDIKSRKTSQTKVAQYALAQVNHEHLYFVVVGTDNMVLWGHIHVFFSFSSCTLSIFHFHQWGMVFMGLGATLPNHIPACRSELGFWPGNPRTLFVGNSQSHRKS